MDNRYKGDDNLTDKTGEVMSWVIIFILLFAFWPIGLLLLFRKLHGYTKPPRRTASQLKERYQQIASQTPARYQQPGQQQAAWRAQPGQQQAAWGTQPGQQQAARGAQPGQHHGARGTQPGQQHGTQGGTQLIKEKQGSAKFVNNIERPTKLQKKTGRFIAFVMLLVSIAMILIGMVGAASIIGQIASFQSAASIEIIMSAFFLFGGIGTFLSRNIVKHRYTRYKNYYAYISGRGVVPLSDLTQVAGVPLKTVKRDVQTMINNSYLEQGVYIDNELDCLVLSEEEAEKLRLDIRGTLSDVSETVEEPANKHLTILEELGEVNSQIVDETISDRVDRLEELTAKIFKIVEENPEKAPQIRRFLSYYLPTTLKLVRSYATLEKQGVKGENILSAKQSIRNILDTLTTGYEQQLDQLFKDDAIDIAADINVLENLMQQDGLTGEKSEFQVMESGMF